MCQLILAGVRIAQGPVRIGKWKICDLIMASMNDKKSNDCVMQLLFGSLLSVFVGIVEIRSRLLNFLVSDTFTR